MDPTATPDRPWHCKCVCHRPISIESRAKVTSRAPQGHLKSTSATCKGPKGTPRAHVKVQGHLKSTSRAHQGPRTPQKHVKCGSRANQGPRTPQKHVKCGSLLVALVSQGICRVWQGRSRPITHPLALYTPNNPSTPTRSRAEYNNTPLRSRTRALWGVCVILRPTSLLGGGRRVGGRGGWV